MTDTDATAFNHDQAEQRLALRLALAWWNFLGFLTGHGSDWEPMQ